MATVRLKPNESQEQLLRRFRKRVTNAGILSTIRRKRWHISKSELRRIEDRGPEKERLLRSPWNVPVGPDRPFSAEHELDEHDARLRCLHPSSGG